eukprot:4919024-Amphidinium_carterae.1
MTSTAVLSFAIASHPEAFMSAEADLCSPHVHQKRPRQPPEKKGEMRSKDGRKEKRRRQCLFCVKKVAFGDVLCLVGMHLVCTSRPRS